MILCIQGLKYNFQGGELFSSLGPQFVPGLPPPTGPQFISWAHVSIAISQIINDWLNVLSMISCCFCSVL